FLAALAFVSSTSNVSSHVPLRPFPESDAVRLCGFPSGKISVSVSGMTPCRKSVRGEVDGEAGGDILDGKATLTENGEFSAICLPVATGFMFGVACHPSFRTNPE
ncbi:hypothetical protein BGX38DRAFT_1193521, partial [Terfezia claveryi]